MRGAVGDGRVVVPPGQVQRQRICGDLVTILLQNDAANGQGCVDDLCQAKEAA